jgi:hypothetical protein
MVFSLVWPQALFLWLVISTNISVAHQMLDSAKVRLHFAPFTTVNI